MTTEKQRGYSLGYVAGRKRAAQDFNRQLAAAQREDFRQRAALVALTALLQPDVKWGTTKDGIHKPYSNMREYSRAAFQFADYLAEHTTFDGVLLAIAMSASGQDAKRLEGEAPPARAEGIAQGEGA